MSKAPQNPPVFFVCGKPQHGKTTVRNLLAQLTHLKGGSCSDVVYHFLAVRRQVSVEALRAEPKEALRPALCEAGDFLCGGAPLHEVPANPEVDGQVYRHPSTLVRTLYLNGYNIIDGVRRRLELQHAREHLDWNGVRSLVIYVDRPGQPEIVDNTEDLRETADEVVSNDGTIEDLQPKLISILEKHFGQQDVVPIPAT
jgi:hypothetical protein